MQALRVRRIGNSLGILLPREMLAGLGLAEGDRVYVGETPGGLRLTAYDENFAAAMTAFETGRRKFRNALRDLAR